MSELQISVLTQTIFPPLSYVYGEGLKRELLGLKNESQMMP